MQTDLLYIAGPWFTPFTNLIKEDMKKKIKEQFKDIQVFDPHETRASKSYDISPSPAVSEQIFKENKENVELCSHIVFPKFTNDLGTLIEIGMALNSLEYNKILNKPQVRKFYSFNYLTQKIEEIPFNTLKKMSERIKKINKPTVFKIETTDMAILIGFNYDNNLLRKSYYYNGFEEDNVMLHELGLTPLVEKAVK